MPKLNETRLKSLAFWVVGLGLIIWNAVFGPESLATFTVGLTLCGIPAVVKLDSLIKLIPTPKEEKEKEKEKENE